jgi:hypothetical protein
VVKDDFFPRLRFLLALIEEQQQQQRWQLQFPNAMSMVCERGWGGQAADSDWSIRSPPPLLEWHSDVLNCHLCTMMWPAGWTSSYTASRGCKALPGTPSRWWSCSRTAPSWVGLSKRYALRGLAAGGWAGEAKFLKNS